MNNSSGPAGDTRWTLFSDFAWDPVLGDLQRVRVEVDGHTIVSVAADAKRQAEDLFLPNHVLTPAFSNGHDHLKYHWPDQAGGGMFQSSYDWIPFLQERANLSFLKEIAIVDLYWLGVFANIFSGAATTLNHARRTSAVDSALFPIRVPSGFRRELMVDTARNQVVWEHRMGNGAVMESLAALDASVPFVVHVAEGTSADSAGEVTRLAEAGALHAGCVLVHAMNLNEEEVQLVADSEASVVWCPSSNLYLFGETAPVARLMDSGINLLLGTDSPCSGSGDLTSEMKLAQAWLVEHAGLAAEESALRVLRMVTTGFGKAFPNIKGGRIIPGHAGDLALFPSEGLHGSVFASVTSKPPSFLSANGRAVLLPRSWYANGLCRRWRHDTSSVTINGLELVVSGRPVELLDRVAEASGVPRNAFPVDRFV